MDKQQSNEASLVGEIYDTFDSNNNVWTALDCNGKEITVLGEDFENGVKRIHAFVDRVRACEEPAYKITAGRSGRINAKRTRVGWIPSSALITPAFRQAYEVSEQVRVFLETEEKLRIYDDSPLDEPLRASRVHAGKVMAEVANDFVQLIRQKVSSKKFRRRLAVRRFGVEENFRRGNALIDALFRRYARLNVLRIDFEYKSEHRPSLDQAQEDLNRLLDNSRNNGIFHSVLGRIWHLEWGFGTGWHWHIIFFLDGAKTRADGYVAKQFCDYWETSVTADRGRCHNCNFDKQRYRELGIGMMAHHEQDKRDVLVNKVLRYLTKVDEVVRPRVPKGTKTFQPSHMPEEHPGTGRKRRTLGMV